MSAYQDYISTYNGSPLTYNGSWLSLQVPKPSALAPYTVRFEFASSVVDPTLYIYHWKSGGTWTRVSSDPNVWDFTYPSTLWDGFDANVVSILPSCKIIDANLRDVISLTGSFRSQSNITSVYLGDLWSLQSFDQPFTGCTSITDFVIGDIGELSSASYIPTNIGDGSFIPAQSSIERFHIGDCYKNMSWVTDSVHSCPYLKSITIGVQYATTGIHAMFKNASGSSKGLTITLGDMPLVEDASQAFRAAGASYSSTDIMESEVFVILGAMPSVTETSEMFAYSYIFGQAPNMDLSNVTNAYHMFEGSHFSSAPRYSMPVCTTAERMFASCPELTEVPLLHINSSCDISQIFYSKGMYDGLRDTLQHPCELFPYYCHPNKWQQYSTSWMTNWFRLHLEITDQNPREIERYYYSDNSWNSTAYTSMALASVSSAVNGQEGIPNQWYDN